MSNLSTNRAWELDLARGLMIWAMLQGHLWEMVYQFCINGLFHIDPYAWINATDPLHFWFVLGEDGGIYMHALDSIQMIFWRYDMQATFFIISGICCTFSRDNLKGGIKLLVWGVFLTTYTFVLYRLTGIRELYMRFGVIMCMALCHLIYEFVFKNAKSKILLIAATPMVIIGYVLIFHPIHSNSAILHVFGIRQYGDFNEYFPIFPYLGWLLIGVVIGRKWYAERKSLIHIPGIERFSKPIQWLGRNSGIIYVVHVVLYRTAFPVIGYCLHIM